MKTTGVRTAVPALKPSWSTYLYWKVSGGGRGITLPAPKVNEKHIIKTEKPNNPLTFIKDPVSGNKEVRFPDNNLIHPKFCSLPGSFTTSMVLPFLYFHSVRAEN